MDTSSSPPAWTQCFEAPNNAQPAMPAMMSDGRAWTQWQSDAETNRRVREEAHVTSNWAYRQYLQAHGTELMLHNTAAACAASGLPAVYDSATASAPTGNTPFVFQHTFDARRPSFGYSTSDLKHPYLTREQLQARMIAPTIRPPSTSQ